MQLGISRPMNIEEDIKREWQHKMLERTFVKDGIALDFTHEKIYYFIMA